MNDTTKKLADTESEALTLEDLNVEELESRLELAAVNAACTCGKFD
jgi:hypothetical protein